MGKEIQYAIGKDTIKYPYNPYIFKCNGCGAECKGYHHKVVYGHVYCRTCTQKRRKEYQLKYWTRKLEELLNES